MRSGVALELSFSLTIVLGLFAFNNVDNDNVGFFFMESNLKCFGYCRSRWMSGA